MSLDDQSAILQKWIPGAHKNRQITLSELSVKEAKRS